MAAQSLSGPVLRSCCGRRHSHRCSHCLFLTRLFCVLFCTELRRAVLHCCLAVLRAAAFEYEDVAKAAVLYGWMRSPKTTCDDLASWMDDQVSDSIPSAGQAIAARASQLLAAYPTTVSEDLRLLEALQRCRERAASNNVAAEELPEGASLADRLDRCALEVVPDLPSIELVLVARLSKKAVLSQLVDRLVHTCEN